MNLWRNSFKTKPNTVVRFKADESCSALLGFVTTALVFMELNSVCVLHTLARISVFRVI